MLYRFAQLLSLLLCSTLWICLWVNRNLFFNDQRISGKGGKQNQMLRLARDKCDWAQESRWLRETAQGKGDDLHQVITLEANTSTPLHTTKVMCPSGRCLWMNWQPPYIKPRPRMEERRETERVTQHESDLQSERTLLLAVSRHNALSLKHPHL